MKDDKDRARTAQEVRDLLAGVGWTHRKAAEVLGVTRVTVSRWVNGHTRIPGHQLRHLKRAAAWDALR